MSEAHPKSEAAGILAGRIAQGDPSELGFGLAVIAGIKAPDHLDDWRDAFSMATYAICGVMICGAMEICRLAGAPDRLLRVALQDMIAFDRLYGRLTDAVPIKKVILASLRGSRRKYSALGRKSCMAFERKAAYHRQLPLRRRGGKIEDIMCTRIYLRDPSAGEPVRRAYGRVFGGIRPAHTRFVAGLIGDCEVEIEAEAVVPANRG